MLRAVCEDHQCCVSVACAELSEQLGSVPSSSAAGMHDLSKAQGLHALHLVWSSSDATYKEQPTGILDLAPAVTSTHSCGGA